MEFASEMVIRAAKQHLDIREFPIEYHRRGGQSKLSSFSDGWRHLRFLLVHSPNHLFVLPGLIMAAIGALIQAVVLFHLGFLGRAWDIHALIAGSLLTIIGAQVSALGVCARALGSTSLASATRPFDRLRARYRLEHGLLLGGAPYPIGGVLVVQIAVDMDRSRLRRAGAGQRCGRRRDAADPRRPGVLHVVPAVDLGLRRGRKPRSSSACPMRICLIYDCLYPQHRRRCRALVQKRGRAARGRRS